MDLFLVSHFGHECALVYQIIYPRAHAINFLTPKMGPFSDTKNCPAFFEKKTRFQRTGCATRQRASAALRCTLLARCAGRNAPVDCSGQTARACAAGPLAAVAASAQQSLLASPFLALGSKESFAPRRPNAGNSTLGVAILVYINAYNCTHIYVYIYIYTRLQLANHVGVVDTLHQPCGGNQARFLDLDFGPFSNEFAVGLLGCLRLSFFAILWAVMADFLSAAGCLRRSFFQPWAV